MSDDDRLLAEAVAAVYAVSPEHFMATRSALVTQAKASGNAAVAKDISRLRRPSVAAWAINNLVRTRPDVVANLIGIGVRMRSAQAALDGPALTALRAPRNAAMSDFTTAALVQAAAQGRFLVATVQDQIEATAVASLADEVAADAVASGALIKALSYSGFGEVDFSDAVVRTATGRLLSVLHGGGEVLTMQWRPTSRTRQHRRLGSRRRRAPALRLSRPRASCPRPRRSCAKRRPSGSRRQRDRPRRPTCSLRLANASNAPRPRRPRPKLTTPRQPCGTARPSGRSIRRPSGWARHPRNAVPLSGRPRVRRLRCGR